MYSPTSKRLKTIICLVVLSIFIPAGAFAVHCNQCSQREQRCVECPKCDGCCKLKVSEGTEKKTCFSVETEQICVPRFVFPWQNCKKKCSKESCCGGCSGSCTGCTTPGGCCGQKSGCGPVNHNGACIRTVHKLKKDSYECPKCNYKWSVEDGEDSEGSCTSAGCTEMSCTQ